MPARSRRCDEGRGCVGAHWEARGSSFRRSGWAAWGCPSIRPARRARRARHDPIARSSSASTSSTRPTRTGRYTNEQLVGKAIAGRREQVILATKFGSTRDEDGKPGSAATRRTSTRRATRRSRLGTDYIDLYYQHRVDKIGRDRGDGQRHGELVAAGKVRYLGLSEASLRRSGARTPSIRSRPFRPSTPSGRGSRGRSAAALRELAIGAVAYRPLGAGFFSGKVTTLQGLEPKRLPPHEPALRRRQPPAQPRASRRMSGARRAEKVVTPAQLALAWLLAQGDDIVPIPGSDRRTVSRREHRRGVE